MKNELMVHNTQPIAAALPACNVPPILQLAQARSPRHIRIVTPAAPRRQFCATERKARAPAVAAELALWMTTGGDFLASTACPQSRSAAVAKLSRSSNELPDASLKSTAQQILYALRLFSATQPRSAH